ncbi:MAG: patatin-like phospholipase family protein [Clostridia bacterium]|nr:patatin-like phospholipase family protein [Clostridia bacterium]
MSKENEKKTLGFALGAGGSRGVAHIGFLQAMEEEGIYPDYVAGCSMGSVVGAAYCAGLTTEAMKNAVYKLRILDVISPSSRRGGLFEPKKVRRLLQRYIGDPDFKDLKKPFRCVAVDMISQSVVEFSEGKVLDGVVASSSIPAVFNPTEKSGMRLIDGGILERVPYNRVKNMGADVVVAVDVLGWRDCSEKMPTTLGVLLETIDLMDNYRTKMKREQDREKIDCWIEPELGNMSQYSFKQFEFAYKKGYEAGKANVGKIKALLR